MNKEKKILYLSPTKAGKIHDFKQLKKIAVIDGIPEDVDILGDKGFIGINDLSSHKTFAPKKKPKNSSLTPEEKEDNSLISLRVNSPHLDAYCKIVHLIPRSLLRGYSFLILIPLLLHVSYI